MSTIIYCCNFPFSHLRRSEIGTVLFLCYRTPSLGGEGGILKLCQFRKSPPPPLLPSLEGYRTGSVGSQAFCIFTLSMVLLHHLAGPRPPSPKWYPLENFRRFLLGRRGVKHECSGTKFTNF